MKKTIKKIKKEQDQCCQTKEMDYTINFPFVLTDPFFSFALLCALGGGLYYLVILGSLSSGFHICRKSEADIISPNPSLSICDIPQFPNSCWTAFL